MAYCNLPPLTEDPPQAPKVDPRTCEAKLGYPDPKEEKRAPDGWYKEHCTLSALKYVDNLREEFKEDPIIAGIAEQAFIAGRTNPAIKLAELQAKIASGELMVPKTAKNVHHEFECSACGFALFDATPNTPTGKEFNFCPGCGAKIIA